MHAAGEGVLRAVRVGAYVVQVRDTRERALRRADAIEDAVEVGFPFPFFLVSSFIGPFSAPRIAPLLIRGIFLIIPSLRSLLMFTRFSSSLLPNKRCLY